MRGEVLQVDFEQDPFYKQHLRDATNADDYPEDEMHKVVLEPGEMTVEATPEAMRWFYDYLQYLVRAWRLEGEQWDAEAASEMASKVWHEHGDDLPDQQRPRKVMDHS